MPDTGGRARLVVMTGGPGSGKSTVAEAIGREPGVPVFTLDWLVRVLTPFGGHHLDRPLEIGPEPPTTLAHRQLSAGRSAILDAPARGSGDAGAVKQP